MPTDLEVWIFARELEARWGRIVELETEAERLRAAIEKYKPSFYVMQDELRVVDHVLAELREIARAAPSAAPVTSNLCEHNLSPSAAPARSTAAAKGVPPSEAARRQELERLRAAIEKALATDLVRGREILKAAMSQSTQTTEVNDGDAEEVQQVQRKSAGESSEQRPDEYRGQAVGAVSSLPTEASETMTCVRREGCAEFNHKEKNMSNDDSRRPAAAPTDEQVDADLKSAGIDMEPANQRLREMANKVKVARDGILYPVAVMQGCPWNVLDRSGMRIACCGGDSPNDWQRTGPPIAAAIVAALNAEQQTSILQTIAKELDVPNTDLLNLLQAIYQLKDAAAALNAGQRAARGDSFDVPAGWIAFEPDGEKQRVFAIGEYWEMDDGTISKEDTTAYDTEGLHQPYRRHDGPASIPVTKGAETNLERAPQPGDVNFRDWLGLLVRDAWIRWAKMQPNPKASWLVPYGDLPETDKEADRMIGEAIYNLERAAASPAATAVGARSSAATDEVAAPKQASDVPRKGQFEAGEPGHKLGSGVAAEHAGERPGDWEAEFDKQFEYRNINGLHVLVHTDANSEQWSSSDQPVKSFIRTVVAEYESRYCDLDEKFVRLDIELIEAEREIARRDERYGWFLQGSVDGLVDTVLDLRYQVKTRDATIATLQSQAAEARLAP